MINYEIYIFKIKYLSDDTNSAAFIPSLNNLKLTKERNDGRGHTKVVRIAKEENILGLAWTQNEITWRQAKKGDGMFFGG